MLVERSDTNQKSDNPDPALLNIWTHNTFFYPKFKNKGYVYEDVKKWTKYVVNNKGESATIFEKDIVFVPIHLFESHWCMGVLNFKLKRIEYYDSMANSGKDNFFKVMRIYLQAEHLEKKEKDFDFVDWQNYFNEKCPQQENGDDCGIFAMTFAEYISRSASFNFTQVFIKRFYYRFVYIL